MLAGVVDARGQQTIVKYLSGTGSDHTVNWDFYCTAGRHSGKWTTIAVPSNWELQGFGTYNYGLDKDSLKGREKGLYKYHFDVPKSWRGKDIDIVFEGVMTDALVKVNGVQAGPVHQGSFYRFKYDITRVLKYGRPNLLEVTVSKYSANASVNAAERKGDFWVFGGIFRPVYLEAFPKQHISHVAVDGKADGSFRAQLKLAALNQAATITGRFYTEDGKPAGSTFSASVHPGDTSVILQTNFASPKLWSPEFPNLYNVVFTMSEGGEAVHTVHQRFGFRTIELRPHDGIYVNNVKIKFKGVNHHSFWPTTGRAMSKAMNIADVKLIKDMNMNAVRMSHYPPDADFLDACDSLGLFVLDELTGWHHAYDTEVGSKLVREMIEKDENHPSIVIWDNGNEGGFNFALDHLFDEIDFQKRPLIHPWAIFRHTDTQHYINYDYGSDVDFHGHDVFFPTEFLHGLYDGGLGAGLNDYWEEMWHNPLSAGGFLWVFADEAVVRTDKNGFLDSDGDHGPDGILGPYHEKEGSYYTIKQVWSPVYVEPKEITPAFDGKLNVENRFFYTNLNQCRFSWKLAKFAGPYGKIKGSEISGPIAAPDVKPGFPGTLQLNLPADWKNYDALYLTAYGVTGNQIFTWSFPIKHPVAIAPRIADNLSGTKPTLEETDSLIKVEANGISLAFSRNSGMLRQVRNSRGDIPFNNGPVLAQGQDQAGFQKLDYHYDADTLVIEAHFARKSTENELQWTVYPSGWLKMDVKYFPVGYESDYMGVDFSYPEKMVKGVTYLGSGPYRVWKNRMRGTSIGVWDKPYNNTETGVDSSKLIYPEFKGYFSNFYWMKLETAGQPVTILCSSRDIFLRLFTPLFPRKPYNTAPPFPGSDISFMHAIPPIGTKSQKAENMGPSGRPNMYYDYGRSADYAKALTLWFDFSGK